MFSVLFWKKSHVGQLTHWLTMQSLFWLFYCAFQHADSKIQRLTDKCVFRRRQSNVLQVLPAFDYCRTLFRCLNCARFDYRALGSSRKLGGAAEHLIDGSEKRICRLSFEFNSLHVIERRSNDVLID